MNKSKPPFRWLVSRSASQKLLFGVGGFLILILGAEAFTRAEFVNPRYLPPASVVLNQVTELFVDLPFLSNVLATLHAWAIGLGLSILIAVPAGILLGSSRLAYDGSLALIEILRPIPGVALIPLAILVLGQGVEMKVALITFSCVWPILFNTIYGVHDVDPVAKDTARSFGYGGISILSRITLPSAAPFIFTGIRFAASVALIVAISAELLTGGKQGIGTWMSRVGETGLRPDLVYAGAIVAGVLGLLINGLLEIAERRFLGWQPALRGNRV